MKQPHHILFQEKWEIDKLPFDDIDVNINGIPGQDNSLQEFLSSGEEQDNDLNIINGANPMFNSSYSNRMRQKHKKLNWKDLGLAELLSANESVQDHTILSRPQFPPQQDQPSQSPHETIMEEDPILDEIAESTDPQVEEFATPVVANRTLLSNLYSRHRKPRKPSIEYQTPQSHARIIR
ncbi:hypothetical protein OGAPHI_001499 [Ogataea philodendri]|uniref:Anaphase-promoting complex subunit 13 n=1 Tax=Ogataea philodendri TaxID=1378263 RepID=A0A9P8T7N6_9ASCO|nr:uncharacterized protein OGAPHI_001499 [Ogataea philodendri]KAH3669378.1 hypothetical protein OGAPHI_001499 [Ogataea philodendri]